VALPRLAKLSISELAPDLKAAAAGANAPCSRRPAYRLGRNRIMLWTIAILLLVLWAVGMVASYTVGGFIHILLAAAIIAVLVRVIQGRAPLR
jgi:hypothetical protein